MNKHTAVNNMTEATDIVNRFLGIMVTGSFYKPEEWEEEDQALFAQTPSREELAKAWNDITAFIETNIYDSLDWH